jgi:predicted RNA polymerase sigma factor
MPEADAALDNDGGDDLLRLISVACHPVLSMEARVALTRRRTDEQSARRDFLISRALACTPRPSGIPT